MTRLVCMAALAAAACTGEIVGVAAGDAGGPASGAVTITSPAEGASFARDQVASDGMFVAPVRFAAEVSPGLATAVAQVEWLAEGTFSLGTGASLTYEYRGDGDRWVDAVARDAAGLELARDTVSFTVTPPPPSDCQGMLDFLGVTWEGGPQNQGVPTPVTVQTPINGMAHRYVSNATPRATFFMDCELAVALWHAADVFAAHGVVEVADIGVYNYRCIDQDVAPPDCPGSSLSMHAYAQAIDIAGITTLDGTYYSVNDDWVIDPDAEDTCAAATEGAKDAFLHEVVCELSAMGIFNILLTPNYNSAHRNHWHVDLTQGADFIERVVPGPGGRFHP